MFCSSFGAVSALVSISAGMVSVDRYRNIISPCSMRSLTKTSRTSKCLRRLKCPPCDAMMMADLLSWYVGTGSEYSAPSSVSSIFSQPEYVVASSSAYSSVSDDERETYLILKLLLRMGALPSVMIIPACPRASGYML